MGGVRAGICSRRFRFVSPRLRGACNAIVRLESVRYRLASGTECKGLRLALRWQGLFTDPIADIALAHLHSGHLEEFRGRLMRKSGRIGRLRTSTVNKIRGQVKSMVQQTYERGLVPSRIRVITESCGSGAAMKKAAYPSA